MNCRNCRYSEKKKMRMTICFKRTAAAVLLLVVSGCSAPAASQHEDTYVCREIDSYNYNEPLPETAESSDLDAFIGGDTRIGSLDLYGTLEEKNTDVYFGESMNIFQVNSVNADGQDETLYDLLMKTEKKNIYLLLGLKAALRNIYQLSKFQSIIFLYYYISNIFGNISDNTVYI